MDEFKIAAAIAELVTELQRAERGQMFAHINALRNRIGHLRIEFARHIEQPVGSDEFKARLARAMG